MGNEDKPADGVNKVEPTDPKHVDKGHEKPVGEAGGGTGGQGGGGTGEGQGHGRGGNFGNPAQHADAGSQSHKNTNG